VLTFQETPKGVEITVVAAINVHYRIGVQESVEPVEPRRSVTMG